MEFGKNKTKQTRRTNSEKIRIPIKRRSALGKESTTYILDKYYPWFHETPWSLACSVSGGGKSS
jgi:hypothetical protein